MAVKVCMVPFEQTAVLANGKVNREEIILGSSSDNLEIISDESFVSVRVAYGSKGGSSAGKVLFSAPKDKVFYALHF